MRKSSSSIAQISIFFAIMVTIHYTSTMIFQFFPFLIPPTFVHIPVVIASIIYGPRIGGILGLLMGLFSLTINTIVQLPSSYLFSPFVEKGNLYSLIIVLVPRILIGITPYFVYKFIHNKTGLMIAAAAGSMTNTFFVLSGIFIFFAKNYPGGIQAFLGAVLTTNSLIEVLATVILTLAIVPPLSKVKKSL